MKAEKKYTSRKEKDGKILQMLASGFRSQQMALELGCSVRTVEADLDRLRLIHKANTPAHLVAIAIREGIVDVINYDYLAKLMVKTFMEKGILPLMPQKNKKTTLDDYRG